MLIDRIEAFAVGNPWKNWILVKVSTDQGHVGWGEATTGLTTMPAFSAIGEIARLFVGRDPRAIQQNWPDAHKALYLTTDGAMMAAMAGIETACWDIAGKELGLPLYRLLGGERFKSLRPFAELLGLGGIDMILPEFLGVGGLWRLKQVAAIAEAHNAMVSPHNAQSPLSTALNVHFDVATPNAFIQECFDDFHVAWSSDLFEGAPVITDGFLAPSEAPGHGVTVNEAETGKHPYSERNFMNLFSAGWEKRNS